jgi:hypothetical protein
MLYPTNVSCNVCRSIVSADLFSAISSGILMVIVISYRLNYTWINTDRKHVQLPAPTYIDYVMTWVQNLLDDENTFPTKSGT